MQQLAAPRWPKGKECMAEPYDVKCVGLLPVFDAGKDELLAACGVDPASRFLAVAVNGTVVRRSEWPSRPLLPGDNVEIVRPFSGG